MVQKLTLNQNYRDWVKRWRFTHPLSKHRAMGDAVGGEFAAMGIIERELLRMYGLREQDYVVDVGCGSGRLAKPLSEFLQGRYLGTDVVPDLVDYARRLVSRADWRFEVVDSVTIPESDGRADFVCFFSVLTHLLHEQSYTYLKEAKRVLKPDGKIVFSFLQFPVACHWTVFEHTLKNTNRNYPLNVFLSRDAITTWVQHLGLSLDAIHDGDLPFIPLPHPISFESGATFDKLGMLGQSVCVLRKP